MRYIFLFLSLLITSYSANLCAYDPVIINCQETPEIYDLNNKPETFQKSNNLRRKPGSASTAKGELIYITGRVVDIKCIPIKNAAVYIWHTNSKGQYQNNTKSNINSDPNFSGSGQTTTNNLGNFNFITIKPGTYNSQAPHINFIVQHPDFIEFSTKMFFEDDKEHINYDILKRYVDDPNLISLLIAPYSLTPEGIKVYHFNITLGEHNPYTKY